MYDMNCCKNEMQLLICNYAVRWQTMEDVLVLILLSVMVTVGMVMVVGGIAGLAINGYRSMRRLALICNIMLYHGR